MKKQKSGLYRTKIKIGTLPDGRPLNKWLSAPTRAGLEEAKRQARAYYIDGTASAEDHLFGAYAQEWFEVRKRPRISPSTAASYRVTLNRYLLPLLGDRQLRAIRPMDLQRIINDLEGRCRTRVTSVITVLRAVFSCALQERLITSDPSVGLQVPKLAPRAVKRAMTGEERQRVEAVALAHPEGLLLAILYWLGVRSGEARGFKWGDVDWIHARISVERDIDAAARDTEGELKTPGSARVLPIPAPLMELLRARRGLPGAYILPGSAPGRPMTSTMAKKRFRKLRDAAGLPQEFSPHWMRHNYITMCRDAGFPAEDTMYLAGHTSYQTTLRVYTHVTDTRLRQLDELTGGMFSSGKSCNKVAQSPDSPSRKK